MNKTTIENVTTFVKMPNGAGMWIHTLDDDGEFWRNNRSYLSIVNTFERDVFDILESATRYCGWTIQKIEIKYNGTHICVTMTK